MFRRNAMVGLALILALGCIAFVTSRWQSSDHPQPNQTDLSTDATHQSESAELVAMQPSASHQRMLTALEEIKIGRDDNWMFGDQKARQLRKQLELISASDTPAEVFDWHYKLGVAELRLGREQEAINALTKAAGLLVRFHGVEKVQRHFDVIFRLGVAYMRLGETQNCCLANNPDSCLLPIQGGGIHSNTEGSTKALRCFEEVIEFTEPDSAAHLQTRWLINLAYMTLGKYPDNVPPAYLIPPDAFGADAPFPRFKNIAKSIGLDTFSLCGGAVADDFDNDGYIDLAVSSYDPQDPLRYFHNNGDGTFVERTKQAGLTGIRGGLNMIHADYDNDGYVDILVLRGAWLFGSGRHPNSLLKNNGDGTFQDVTFAAGLGDNHYPTQTASWADIDNDGDLDLYVGNESSGDVQAPCQLFRNQGDGTFQDIAKTAGVTNNRFTKGVIFGDYDGDHDPDIYVTNLDGPNRLYQNQGDGTFSDVAAGLGVTKPDSSFPCWFWDVDNDGHLDIFASSYSGDIADSAASALGLPIQADLPRLYRGNGTGGFDEVGEQYNLRTPSLPMGSNFADVNGDGYLDFYLGTGDPDFMNLMPSQMYLNQSGKSFADVTTSGGFGNLQKGHAIAFADFDNDGDLDIFAQMGGAFPGDRYNDSFYENPGFGNHWLTLKLVGIKSNRSAIGARIRVTLPQPGSPAVIYRHVNSGGSFGANSLRQNIGIGNATEIAKLEILWPTTGKTQTFTDLPIDQCLEIREDSMDFRVINAATFSFAR